MSIKQNCVVDVLGWVLSPIKLAVLFILIIFGVIVQHHPLALTTPIPTVAIFQHSLEAGYSTMDLFGAIFFCAFIHRAVRYKLSKKKELNSDRTESRLTLYACLLGALLLTVVYSFFIFIANYHAADLQNIPTQNLIGELSLLLLHETGTLFVAICVGIACFSTAIAINAVTVEFIHTHIVKKRVSYHMVLFVVVCIAFTLSTLGFTRLMQLIMPVLNVLYPALVGLTIGNIVYKLKGWDIGATLFFIGLFAAVLLQIYK